MESLTCRLLPLESGDGAHNMAADETLLLSAAQGVASLRFYQWTAATVSLGYFQPESRRLEDARLAALPFVRRPTGGDALVHHHELTYCLAIPSGSPWQSGEPWLQMHTIIAAALAEFGIAAHSHVCSASGGCYTGFLCFHHLTAGDLLVNGHKIVGSAQRKQRGAIMQHGGILLKGSPFTPSLPGIWELVQAAVVPDTLMRVLIRQVERHLGWHLQPGDWTDPERQRLDELARERYASEIWNRKR